VSVDSRRYDRYASERFAARPLQPTEVVQMDRPILIGFERPGQSDRVEVGVEQLVDESQEAVIASPIPPTRGAGLVSHLHDDRVSETVPLHDSSVLFAN
jgi:hypothetical protein